MAGAQEETAASAGKALWRARQDLQEAKNAPHTGSASTERLRNAQTRCDNAEAAFDTAYTNYHTSMSNASQRARDKSSFIIR